MTEGVGQNLWIIRRLGKQRYLLAALITLLVLLPMLTDAETGRFWISMLMTVIMITGPLSIATRRFDFYFSLLVGLVMTVTSWLETTIQTAALQYLNTLATVTFFLTLSVLIFRQYLLTNRDVNSETLIAAVNAYICIGIMYAFAYFFTLRADPTAFSGTFIDIAIEFQACVYLSFVTMTTLGYGDITPQSDLAAVLTWTQALVGQLFIALTIARIVGVMVAKETS